MITYLKGDIFNSPAQVITNAVNTEGIMGKGIALEFKNRYPGMFSIYKEKCEKGEFSVGKLILCREKGKTIMLFPTKTTWKKKSEISIIETGLKKFADNWDRMGISSVAFPKLGCGLGGLDWDVVHNLMEKYLRNIPIAIYIYTDAFFDSTYIEQPVSNFERIIDPKSCMDGFELFRNMYDSYLREVGSAELYDGHFCYLSETGRLVFDNIIVDDEELIRCWNYIRNTKIISIDDAYLKDKKTVISVLELMKKLNCVCRVYVSKNGVEYPPLPNGYQYRIA
jgi:O-acetyl-ADP-ribose deacetylase (regulator of RNase III)